MAEGKYSDTQIQAWRKESEAALAEGVAIIEAVKKTDGFSAYKTLSHSHAFTAKAPSSLKSSVPMVKVVGDLPFSPKRAYELIHTPNQPWATGETKDFDSWSVGDKDYRLYEFSTRPVMGGMISARSISEIGVKMDFPDGSITTVYMSREDERIPERKGVIRAHMYPSTLMLTANPNDPHKCNLTSIVHSDIKGSLFQWMVTGAMIDEMNKMYKMMIELYGPK